MSVGNVNNVNFSNNTLIATGTGAVIGAGAGITTAVMSKPYLNGFFPTDKFISKSIDNFSKSSNEDVKSMGTTLKGVMNTVKNVSTHEDILNAIDAPVEKIINMIPDEEFENVLLKGKGFLEGMGENLPAELKLLLENINTKQDVSLIAKNMLYNKLKEIPVADLKSMGKDIVKMVSSMGITTAQMLKEGILNPTANEKAFLEAVKSAASSITKMSALKYGGIGAVTLGGAGLASSLLLNKENETVETKKAV